MKVKLVVVPGTRALAVIVGKGTGTMQQHEITHLRRVHEAALLSPCFSSAKRAEIPTSVSALDRYPIHERSLPGTRSPGEIRIQIHGMPGMSQGGALTAKKPIQQ